MSTTSVNIRMDADVKKKADALFNEMGMNLSTAFNIFVRQALRDRAIPFQIQLDQPNKDTIATMFEAEHTAQDSHTPTYTTAHDAIRATLSED